MFRRGRKNKRVTLFVTVLIVCVPLVIYFLQHFLVHWEEGFILDYPRVMLTEDSDADTFLQQAGLGKSAVDKLLAEDQFEKILEVQEAFWQPRNISCEPVLGWFTREDRLTREKAPEFVDLQPGDILITLSTHSLGWRHGHAALVIDADTTLECAILGTDSCYRSTENWRNYSEYCVLRVKNVTPKLQQEVTEYACQALYGVPYHLSAGFIGPKAPDTEENYFGLQCAYLVWYAWNHFGYDLDGDGGRLVSSRDILESELLEVVQIYGMLPHKTIKNL